jgi:hypothetical protein
MVEHVLRKPEVLHQRRNDVMPSASHDPVWWKRCPRSGRADINVASFDLTFDGQIKLIGPPPEPITHALERAKP